MFRYLSRAFKFIAALIVACLALVGAYFAWPYLSESKIDTTGQSEAVRLSGDDTLIVFIHGVTGNARGTWTNSIAGRDAYWPDIIKSDPRFDHSDIFVYDYYSTPAGPSLTFEQLAQTLYITLKEQVKFEEYHQLFFVNHSMGGLIARKLVLDHADLAEKVSAMAFFGTPTNGNALADVLRHSPNPQFNSMRYEDRMLVDMQQAWKRQRFTFPSICAYESVPNRVVTYESAVALCNREDIPLLYDHVQMVKPASKSDDTRYDVLLRTYREGFEHSANSLLEAADARLDEAWTKDDGKGVQRALSSFEAVLQWISQSDQELWAKAKLLHAEAAYKLLDIVGTDAENAPSADTIISNFEEALPVAKTELAASDCARAHYFYAETLMAFGDTAALTKAIDAIEHSLSDTPEPGDNRKSSMVLMALARAQHAWRTQGTDQERTSDLKTALKSIDEALPLLDPKEDRKDYLDLRTWRGRVLLDLGRITRSASMLDEARQLLIANSKAKELSTETKAYNRFYATQATYWYSTYKNDPTAIEVARADLRGLLKESRRGEMPDLTEEIVDFIAELETASIPNAAPPPREARQPPPTDKPKQQSRKRKQPTPFPWFN